MRGPLLRVAGMFLRFHGLILFLAVLCVTAVADPILRVPVESALLRNVGFDAKKNVLEVQFTHGGIYRYFEVPAETHAALMKSDSKGKFFQATIRKKFRFERVSSGK